LRVLVVEDNPLAFRVLEGLAPEMTCAPVFSWARSYEEGLALLRAGGWDMCLMDQVLDRLTGLDLLRTVRAEAIRTPTVMLTCVPSTELDVEAIRAGATDFLVKGEFDADGLDRVLRYAVERQRAADRLHESEERYALAVLGANDGIWDWRITSRDLYFSPRCRELLGLSEQEIPNDVDGWQQRVHPDDLPRLFSDLKAHVRGHTALFESELRLRHRDGSWCWLLARGAAVRDREGRATRMAGSVTDITHGRARDHLTGLPNRTLLMDRLGRAFARRARDPAYEFAVVFLDLDRFNVVNEGLGHHAGDALLVQVARRMERCLRETDTLARMGGDEFTLLLDGVRTTEEAAHVARRILDALEEPFEVVGRTVYAGASLGIALSNAGYAGPHEILRDADTALSRAKTGGRGRHQVFSPGMHVQALGMLQMENELRRAVERNELRAFFQPIFSVRERRLVGLEALVRWIHPTQGLLSPDRFIPLAEETGLVQLVDDWMLRAVAAQLGAWRAKLPFAAELTVNINASKRQLESQGFVERVLEAAAVNGLPRGALVLEITEGMVFESPERTSAVLGALRDAGICVVMDDFGTGYSSLSYLHKLPLAGLKVDRSFVSRMDGGSGAEAVRAIVALAHGLGLKVTAEGVDSEAQMEHLDRLGCELAQGYLFSRPVDATGAEDLLNAFLGRRVKAG
ncbi:MAG: EAL domain-containing protein, partial [Deltaproteobacteria bacterium]|nr:EAL domain-containing protein [Deltaproteobacteria bacterium]